MRSKGRQSGCRKGLNLYGKIPLHSREAFCGEGICPGIKIEYEESGWVYGV